MNPVSYTVANRIRPRFLVTIFEAPHDMVIDGAISDSPVNRADPRPDGLLRPPVKVLLAMQARMLDEPTMKRNC